jgi:hypothetical protein
MFWVCPVCGNHIDFYQQVRELFDESGQAYFDSESGVIFHLIMCDKCNSAWTMSISEREMLG